MKIYLVLIVVMIWSYTGLAQTHFTSAHAGTNAEAYMNVWVYSAKIGGVNLQTGDEIAVFDGSVCVGVKALGGELTSPVSVKAAKTDAGLSNGYVSGHSITVKIWDSSASKEYNASVEFKADSPFSVFADNESAYINLTVVEALTVTLTAQNKVYDGTDAVTTGYTVTGGTITGNVVVTVSNAKFSNKNIGTGKTVTADITITGSDASNYTFTLVKTTTANITAKALSVTGAAAQNKIYDGTTAAQVTGAVLSGAVSGDAVNLSNGGAGTFAQTNVGNDIAVNTAMSLTGTDAGNYTLTQPSGLKANITVRPTTIKPDARSKSYGSTDPALTYQAVPAIVSGESFTGAIGRASGESVGTYDFTLGNLAASSNYSLTLDATPKFQITRKTLYLSGLNVSTKVYDGTTNATLTGTASLSGVIGSENVSLSGTPSGSFSTSSAGSGIIVNISGLSLTGANAGNYTLIPSITGNITRKELTVSGASAQSKEYDGTTSAVISGAVLVGKISGDDVSLVIPVSGTFAQNGVGTGIDVSALSMSLTGSAASNYILIYPTGLKADINKKALTIAAGSKSKCYGSTLAFAGTEYTTSGLVTGDAVSGVTLTCNGSATDAAAGIYDIVPSAPVGTGLANYTVTFVNGKLTVDALPVPAISGSASVTQAPATVTYTTDAGMSNYVWAVTAGGKITSGAGTNKVIVDWTEISNQSITVSYANAGGCSGTATKSITLFPLPTALISGSATICPETTAKLTVVLTGTSPWKITYTDGTTPKTISNISSSPYTIEVAPVAGTSTTYTIIDVSDGNSMINKGSGSAVVTSYPQISAPTVSNVATLCYANEAVVMATAPANQSSQVKYQWQSSDDNITWTDIANTNSLSYTTGALYNSVYLRVVASIGTCSSKTSNAVKISVNEPLTNAVVTSDQQTICYGSMPSKLTASPSSGGNGKFSYQWQKKVAGVWVNVSNTTLTYQPEQLLATTSFRLITRDLGSPSCGSVYSNEYIIVVKSPTLGGTIGNDQKIVTGATPAPLFSLQAGTGGGTIKYAWEYSTDGGFSWATIPGETAATYGPKALTLPTWYRRTTLSTENLVVCTATSNIVKIALWPTAVNPSISEDNLIAYPIRNKEIRIIGPIKNKSIARLYNIQGKELLNKLLEISETNSIYLNGINSGIYLLVIKSEDQISKFKLMLCE